MWTVEIVVVLAMIAFNSVFAAYEIALASVGLGRLHVLANEQRRGAAAALQMKQKMESSLAVVQIGITLVGITAAATGGAGAEESIEPLLRQAGLPVGVSQFLAIAIVVAPLFFFTILLGELVPKVYALQNKEWVCLKLSPPMRWFSYCVWPAVWILEGSVSCIMKCYRWGRKSRDPGEEETTLQELQGAAALARTARLIGRREEGIIMSASRLATTPLRRIMLPAQHIGMLAATQTLAEALATAHEEAHTRFPVTEEEGDPQQIIGYVNFKDMVAALRITPNDPSLRNLVRPLTSFHLDLSVADCLERLIRERKHIGLVRDDDGATVGMVTLEDIMEELVGEIHDEFDRIPSHLTPAGSGWIAGGFISLRSLREKTGIQLHLPIEKPLYTLNDWIAAYLGRLPHGGDEIHHNGCRIIVRKTRQTLVQEAYLCKTDQSDLEDAALSERAGRNAE